MGFEPDIILPHLDRLDLVSLADEKIFRRFIGLIPNASSSLSEEDRLASSSRPLLIRQHPGTVKNDDPSSSSNPLPPPSLRQQQQQKHPQHPQYPQSVPLETPKKNPGSKQTPHPPPLLRQPEPKPSQDTRDLAKAFLHTLIQWIQCPPLVTDRETQDQSLAELLGPFADFWALLSQQPEMKLKMLKREAEANAVRAVEAGRSANASTGLPQLRLIPALRRTGVSEFRKAGGPPPPENPPSNIPDITTLDISSLLSNLCTIDTPSKSKYQGLEVLMPINVSDANPANDQDNDQTNPNEKSGPPDDPSWHHGTESLQMEIFTSLLNAFMSIIQLGSNPALTAVSNQLRLTFGDPEFNRDRPGGSTSAYISCVDGVQYGLLSEGQKKQQQQQTDATREFTALIESKREKRPNWVSPRMTPKETICQVRRQESAEQVAYAYTHRKVLIERAMKRASSSITPPPASQLLWSISENHLYLTITEMPLPWLQYIDDMASPVCPLLGHQHDISSIDGGEPISCKAADIDADTMLGIWEFGPARLDNAEDLQRVFLVWGAICANLQKAG